MDFQNSFHYLSTNYYETKFINDFRSENYNIPIHFKYNSAIFVILKFFRIEIFIVCNISSLNKFLSVCWNKKETICHLPFQQWLHHDAFVSLHTSITVQLTSIAVVTYEVQKDVFFHTKINRSRKFLGVNRYNFSLWNLTIAFNLNGRNRINDVFKTL